MRRLIPPVLLFVFIAVMIGVDVFLDVPTLVPPLLRWFALPLIAGGLALSVAVKRQLAHMNTTFETFERPHRLVTSGAFRLSRNPIYLGLALVAVGCALSLGSAVSFALAALFILVTDRWYIRFEEAMLHATFGERFVAYARSTRRWV